MPLISSAIGEGRGHERTGPWGHKMGGGGGGGGKLMATAVVMAGEVAVMAATSGIMGKW